MSYEPTEWKTGDIVTSAKLNKMEQGIAAGSTGDTFITCEMSATNNSYPFVITNMDKVCDALDAIRENPETASQYVVLVNSSIGDFPSTLYTFKPYFYADPDGIESGDHIRVSCWSSLNPEQGYGTEFVSGGYYVYNGDKVGHYEISVAGEWWFDRDALDENGTLTAYAM